MAEDPSDWGPTSSAAFARSDPLQRTTIALVVPDSSYVTGSLGDRGEWGPASSAGYARSDPLQRTTRALVVPDSSYVTGGVPDPSTESGPYLPRPGRAVHVRAPLQFWTPLTADPYIQDGAEVGQLAPRVYRAKPNRTKFTRPRGRDPIISNGALFHTGLRAPYQPIATLAPNVVSKVPAPVTRRPLILAGALRHTGLTGIPPAGTVALRVPHVVHRVTPPTTRAPLIVNGALFHTGKQRFRVPTFLAPHVNRRVQGPTTRRPLMLHEALLHCGNLKYTVAILKPRVVPRVPRPVTREPIFVRPHLIDWGRRYGAARGLYRIFGPAEYRFYRSSSGPPLEGDSPFATSSALPETPTTSFADGLWYVSVSYFNGLIDSGFLALGDAGETYRTVTIASGGSTTGAPAKPLSAHLELRAGGVVRLVAFYAETGSARADAWAVAYTVDGSTPSSGAPTVTKAFTSSGPQTLVRDLPAQLDGTTVKVLVQVRRGSSSPVYSLPFDVLTATADASGPSEILGGELWTGDLPDGVT